MKHWIVMWGENTDDQGTRRASGETPLAAMRDAYGMVAENMSVRQIQKTMSQKKVMETINDMKPKHLARIATLRPGHDRLVLPGLVKNMGAPAPKEEEFIV